MMLRQSLLLLFWAATIVSGDNVATNLSLPLESPIPATNKDALVPFVPSESTASNSTTIPPTKKEFTPPTTPTSKPTTSKPTTSKPTTSKPTTPSTTAVPTTPVVPTTPLPPPSTGKWIVQENNTYCIIVQMVAQLSVSYVDAKNKTIHEIVDIPNNSNSTGKCGKSEQTLTLLWGTNNSTQTASNNFTLHFVKNETEKHYSLHHLEISLMEKSSTDKSNKTVMTLIHMAPQFDTGLSNSYRCVKEQSLNLTLQGKNETVGQLKVSKLQFQAFRNDNTTVFGLAKDCSFDTPDIVPITVGCALAGLVVVVLIAYLVGRRRSQSRGYLSM
ncbi:lysosome-associated membrane glycoprotein 1 isoform X2 [Nylanderia fulva]|uniref:lysosome-associated membrane glycoprotein 1 isoform X2 n=1 Tax=Nylanderia fulva TaxID=613905 RepID=UPI0010FB17E3|nr:lysosome-associated membrane glycoprotein 1 isoform X2 [Nylanderia fulva]